MKKYKNTHTIRGEKKVDCSVILLCGGEGLRMKTYGVKSLIQLNNEHTIISRQLELIQNTISPKEIIIVGGFEAERLFNKTPTNILKVENEKFAETNVCRSLGIGLRITSTEFIVVIHGDLVFTQNALTFPLSRSLLIADNNYMNQEEVGMTICDGEVEHLYYDLPKKWGQIATYTRRELKLLRGICYNSDKFRLYGFEVINEIMNKGGRFFAYENENIRMVDVDSPKDILKAQQLIKGN